MPTRIFSIGHSTRPIAAFLSLLGAHQVVTLADVRTIPGSRRNRQYGQALLARSLADLGVSYLHLPQLGGLRKPLPDSTNAGWRNSSFRGYADHMASAEFAAGLSRLLELAEQAPTAIMCAEAVPWRCHRSLIADALVVRGLKVLHIVDGSEVRPHALTPFARVEGDCLTYPASRGSQ